MNKKAYFFSIDALIALTLILGVVLVVKPHVTQIAPEMHLQEDTIKVLSSLKIGEIDNDYAKNLISQGKITTLNNSVLEQIGEFYATSSPEAELLANSVLSQLSPNENIGLYFNNQPITIISSLSQDNAKDIWASRQIISGIQQGESVKGYSSRALLLAANKIKYFYFGGYVGDGNITARISYTGNITSAYIEAAFSKPFDLYINNQFVSSYSPPNSTNPFKIDLTSYLTKFSSGDNNIEFKGNNLYISGGYVKVSYQSSEQFSLSNEHSFPGIDGTINLYDSFYIPGTLNSMEIFLHYNSDYQIFMNIGNKTVYNKNPTGQTTDTVTNSQLASILDYSQLSQKTMPIRLGLNALQITGKTGNADVVLITDITGSMDSRMNSDSTGTTRSCTDPLLYDSSTKRISVAECLDKQVIDKILNVSGNRVALSAFYGDDSSPNKGRVYQENLNNNSAYLKSRIDLYSPQGGTCICCAINDAYKILNEQSNSNRSRFIIVMSDGIPTHTCQAASGCTGTRTGLPSDEGLWLGYGAGCYGGLDDCNVNDCECASINANWSSCRAHNDLNAVIYSIGFGPLATCNMANKTLNNIAKCGEGAYYTSDNATILSEFYNQISQEILELSYTEQVSVISGNFKRTILYPDSHISYTFTSPSIPYGLVTTIETDDFNNQISQGNFLVPTDSQILEANAISYSGSKWTSEVKINTSSIFKLSDYGSDFLQLGDPYIVNLPTNYIRQGNNLVTISTATKPNENLGGSSSDKVIYTILRPLSGYSDIKSSAKGCLWNIEFESGENMTFHIPSNYTGADNCYYNSKNIAYNNNDAIDLAVYNLLSKLDIDNNHMIDTKFSQNDIQISSSEISGIPFTWESEVQVRVWR